MSDVATASELNRITSTIVGAAIDVHRAFGPGLLEHAYVVCLLHELAARGCRVEHQKSLPLVYRGITIDCAYRADLVVDGQVLIEVKALDAIAPIHRRQVQTYLRLGDYRVGLLLNFGAETPRGERHRRAPTCGASAFLSPSASSALINSARSADSASST